MIASASYRTDSRKDANSRKEVKHAKSLSVIFCALASLREIGAAVYPGPGRVTHPKNTARAAIAWIGRGLVFCLSEQQRLAANLI
jgi:hypothetical protein